MRKSPPTDFRVFQESADISFEERIAASVWS
jgi:hypothetical protein